MTSNVSAVRQQTAPLRLRVMHVLFHLDVGGVEIGVVNLTRGLAALGYEQSVCCFERPGTLRARIPPEVPVWACGRERRERWLPLVRAAVRMRAFGPDVVHARNDGAWRNAAAAWLLAGCPGRLVFSIHGHGPERPLHWRAAMRYRLLARITTRLAAVSDVTARQFAVSTGIPLDRFDVLHSGVDIGRFHPQTVAAQTPASRRPLVIGCVARMDGLKGHDTLLQAFAALRQRTSVPLQLHLVGDGPRRPMLMVQTHELGIASAVQFLGECGDMPQTLQRFDLFVLASRQEGRPTSIMEAMAVGLPVVATRVGAVAELLGEGDRGVLVEPDHPQALADALLALVHDPARRQAMGAAGRRLATERLSLASMTRRYDAFYNAAVARRGLPQR